jgi:hypothetical protein
MIVHFELRYSGAWGKAIHEKNLKSKISWHCPFNCNPPPPPTSSFHQLSPCSFSNGGCFLFDVCTLHHGGTRRPLRSRLRIICSWYHLHGRACVGGGRVTAPSLPPPHLIFQLTPVVIIVFSKDDFALVSYFLRDVHYSKNLKIKVSKRFVRIGSILLYLFQYKTCM